MYDFANNFKTSNYVYISLYVYILNQSITDKNQLMYNLAYVQKSQMLLKGEGLNKIYRAEDAIEVKWPFKGRCVF